MIFVNGGRNKSQERDSSHRIKTMTATKLWLQFVIVISLSQVPLFMIIHRSEYVDALAFPFWFSDDCWREKKEMRGSRKIGGSAEVICRTNKSSILSICHFWPAEKANFSSTEFELGYPSKSIGKKCNNFIDFSIASTRPILIKRIFMHK